MGERQLVEAFQYEDGAVRANGKNLAELADEFGTPLYVYSEDSFRRRYRQITTALADVVSRDGKPPLICYSVKANSNMAVLRVLAAEGAGFDIVSYGELLRVIEAGADPAKIVFAGVGKGDDELRYALDRRIGFFNVESAAELQRLEAIATELKLGPQSVNVNLRLNPDVDPETHAYISTGKKENKFGIDLTTAAALVADWEYVHLRLSGLHLHIGSQIPRADRYEKAMASVAGIVRGWAAVGHAIDVINLGGGFFVDYQRGETSDFNLLDYAERIDTILEDFGRPRLLVEPGRYISAPSGVMLTRIRYIKTDGERNFYICDAGMSDLLRPSLYSAHHTIWPAQHHGPAPILTDAPAADSPGTPAASSTTTAKLVSADVVGPICESGDFLGLKRELPPLTAGDLLVVFHAGAYGFVMASNYNTRPRPAEVLVDAHGRAKLVRRRETYDDLLALERLG